jgi:hypothetical protein
MIYAKFGYTDFNAYFSVFSSTQLNDTFSEKAASDKKNIYLALYGDGLV